jgi:Glycosyl hydrolase family 76
VTTVDVAAARASLFALVVAATLWVGADTARTAGPTMLRPEQRLYLQLAKQGMVKLDQVWGNPRAHWYTTYPYKPSWGKGGLATLWDVVPVFETLNLIAIADPRPATRAAVRRIALGAERYWNPDAGGYAFLRGQRGDVNTFFDDSGWWGLDFFDAYRATHDRRFVVDAARAFHFIVTAGWAGSSGGGIWWDTDHEKKTAEPLAAGALLGALLYEATHQASYLRWSRKLIAWADVHSWNADRRLYQRSDVSDTVMNYVEGMMIGAHAVLCRALRRPSDCDRAEELATAAQVAFPPSYHWTPETDAIYLRWLLELSSADGNRRWYSLAVSWARRAAAHARDARGLYTRRWDGGYASKGRLLTDGGTLMLFAAVAAASPPGTASR